MTTPAQETAQPQAESARWTDNWMHDFDFGSVLRDRPDIAYLYTGAPPRQATEAEAAQYAARAQDPAWGDLYGPELRYGPDPLGAGFTPEPLPQRIPQRVPAADLPGPETGSVATGEAPCAHAPGNLAQVRAGEPGSTDGPVPGVQLVPAVPAAAETGTEDTEAAPSSAKPLTESQELAAAEAAAKSAAALEAWSRKPEPEAKSTGGGGSE